MTKGRRLAVCLLLAAALALAILGQFYFFYRAEYLWDGVVFHGLAALCFLLAWRQSRARERRVAESYPSRLTAWLRAHPLPASLLVLGAFSSLLATLMSRGRTLDQPTQDAVLFWVLGIGALGLAAVWPDSWPSSLLRTWKERCRAVRRETWLEAATVAALALLAFVLRIAALDSVPFTLGGDEAWFGLTARQVLSGQVRNPFVTAYVAMPTLFYWPVSWAMRLAGDGMTGLRLPAALVGTATVPVLYLFARDLWGRRTALISATFLATYDYHIHYSRLGANNVWDPLLVVLSLWALDRGLTAERGSRRGGKQGGAYRSFLLAGLAMGLSVYFYTGARLLPLLAAVYTTFVWFRRRQQLRWLGVHLALLVLAFLVVAGPMLSYAQAHPDDWNARINQVGIVQSGWLDREPELTGKSTAQILAEQFLRAAGAFHALPDRTMWYGADRPLLGFLAGAFAVLGMAWAVAHWRDRRYFLVLLWFWAVIISGGMLTESPPSSQRLVIAIPTVALLVAFGLERSVRLASRLLQLRREWESIALGLLVAILAVGSIRYYFVEFTPTRRYGTQNGETATMIGYYLRDLEGDWQAYFFGAPRILWKFGTMSFLAPDVPAQDVTEPLDAPPDFVVEGRGAVFIFLPERKGELKWVQQAFPGGRVREFSDSSGRPRFAAYEVNWPRPTPQSRVPTQDLVVRYAGRSESKFSEMSSLPD